MAFGTQDDSDEVMNEINMTPLVDVMLVLLIVFIITVPVMKHAVNVDLPRATNQPEEVKPENVRLSVDGRWPVPLERGEAIGDEQLWSPPASRGRQGAAARPAHPWRQATCATSGWPPPWRPPSLRACKIGFVTEPER